MTTQRCRSARVRKPLIVYVLSHEPTLLTILQNDADIARLIFCKLRKKVVFTGDVTPEIMSKTDEDHCYLIFDTFEPRKKTSETENARRAIFKRASGNVIATYIEKDTQNIFARIKPLLIRLLEEIIQEA